jgi:hypothetical protein
MEPPPPHFLPEYEKYWKNLTCFCYDGGMRLGLMSFGNVSPEIERITVALRARDVDVVQTEEPLTTLGAVRREAARLHRADCDGIAFIAGEQAPVQFFGQAIVHIGCPVLLIGAFASEFFDASAALSEIGAAFDRFTGTVDADERIFAWLTQNKKTERQPGIEAAQKLYGQFMTVGGDGMVDAALWKRQFGVSLLRGGTETESDFYALDGDAPAALAAQLLRLISGGEPYLVAIDALGKSEPLPPETTLAQIARLRGGFVCRCFSGIANLEVWESGLIGSRVWAIPGNYAVALRAACEALDIDFKFCG